MPPLLEFDDSGAWRIRPDLVVTSEEFFMKGMAPDYWGDIQPIEIPLEEDRYVAAMQVREVNDLPVDGPGRETVGGRYIVHHLTFPGFLTHEVGRNEDIFDADAGRLLRAGSTLRSTSLHLHSNGLDTRGPSRDCVPVPSGGVRAEIHQKWVATVVLGQPVTRWIWTSRRTRPIRSYMRTKS